MGRELDNLGFQRGNFGLGILKRALTTHDFSVERCNCVFRGVEHGLKLVALGDQRRLGGAQPFGLGGKLCCNIRLGRELDNLGFQRGNLGLGILKRALKTHDFSVERGLGLAQGFGLTFDEFDVLGVFAQCRQFSLRFFGARHFGGQFGGKLRLPRGLRSELFFSFADRGLRRRRCLLRLGNLLRQLLLEIQPRPHLASSIALNQKPRKS